LRLQSEFFGAAQHLRHTDIGAKAMADLLRIGANAVESHQQHQSGSSGLCTIRLIGRYKHAAPRFHAHDCFLIVNR